MTFLSYLVIFIIYLIISLNCFQAASWQATALLQRIMGDVPYSKTWINRVLIFYYLNYVYPLKDFVTCSSFACLYLYQGVYNLKQETGIIYSKPEDNLKI